MNELLGDLSSLVMYLKASGADKDYKIGYVTDKLETLIKKYGGEDERQD